MTKHKALYPKDNINRLYVSRKAERWLANIEDNVYVSTVGLENNIKKSI